MFRVTESTLSAIDLSEFIREKYQLGQNTTCKLFRTGMNHSYNISDGNNRFIFRVYTLNWRTRTEISEELRLLNHLLNHAIGVAYPIGDKDGDFIQDLHAPEGLRYGVLFSFAEGKKVSVFTAPASYHIGQTMARIHEVTKGFELKRVTYNSSTLLTDSLAKTKAFFTKPSEEMSFVESATHYLKTKFDQIQRPDVRFGAIHLDIWFDNMHLNGEDKITIFDFDFCGNGWLCNDIAYFLFQLYNTNQVEKDFQLKSESFFKGYQELTVISDEEKGLIPMLGIGTFLFYLGIQCATFDTWSNVFLTEDYLKRFVGIMKRWADYNNVMIQT